VFSITSKVDAKEDAIFTLLRSCCIGKKGPNGLPIIVVLVLVVAAATAAFVYFVQDALELRHETSFAVRAGDPPVLLQPVAGQVEADQLVVRLEQFVRVTARAAFPVQNQRLDQRAVVRAKQFPLVGSVSRASSVRVKQIRHVERPETVTRVLKVDGAHVLVQVLVVAVVIVVATTEK